MALVSDARMTMIQDTLGGRPLVLFVAIVQWLAGNTNRFPKREWGTLLIKGGSELLALLKTNSGSCMLNYYMVRSKT